MEKALSQPRRVEIQPDALDLWVALPDIDFQTQHVSVYNLTQISAEDLEIENGLVALSVIKGLLEASLHKVETAITQAKTNE